MSAQDNLSQHQFPRVAVENITAGMMVRPTWGDFPFEQATGNAFHDKDHPGNNEDKRMYVIPYARKYSPHQPNGTLYQVRP